MGCFAPTPPPGLPPWTLHPFRLKTLASQVSVRFCTHEITCIKITISQKLNVAHKKTKELKNHFQSIPHLSCKFGECRTKVPKTKAPRTEAPWIKTPKTKPPGDKSPKYKTPKRQKPQRQKPHRRIFYFSQYQ